jgi:hypothetical protein
MAGAGNASRAVGTRPIGPPRLPGDWDTQFSGGGKVRLSDGAEGQFHLWRRGQPDLAGCSSGPSRAASSREKLFGGSMLRWACRALLSIYAFASPVCVLNPAINGCLLGGRKFGLSVVTDGRIELVLIVSLIRFLSL